MPLHATRPVLDPDGYFMAKEAAAFLGVTHRIFMKYRRKGFIAPVNEGSTRPKFLGQAIMNCYDKAISQ